MAELNDLGFKGPPFTWHRDGLFESLDRALHTTWVRRPFWFLAGWVEYLDFGNFVGANWNFSEDMSNELNKLINGLKDWNKSVYNHITTRKKNLINKLGVRTLINLIPTNVNIVSDCLLNEMAIVEGLWNLDLFKKWLLDDVVLCIVGAPPPHPSKGTDRVAWCYTSIRAFPIKSAYRILNEESWSANNDKWKYRVRRGLAVDPCFRICIYDLENTLHVVRDYPAAKVVWRQDTTKVHDGGANWACLEHLEESQPPYLLRILEGLKLIRHRGHDKVIIQSDSLEVVKAIQGSVLDILYSTLIRWIQCILSQEGQWILRYIFREHNHVVDHLAKFALSNKEDLQVFDSPPMEILAFIESDRSRGFSPFQNNFL
ncbi:hypothetical protein Goari_004619 [Gossypium aridum]|uniref:RNase H type-1 domain-containing protein n=1 Tax=Gossypium aridum TaxID=34290 RepID=A0A7J8Y402_GOSAI|nr:hypothetical protein [Gossypium aridum]